MNEEAINEMMKRGDRAALLLGEICGSLSVLSKKVTEMVHGEELKNDIDQLFNMVMNRVNSIYYENK
jgi:hypothetical protein